MNVLRLLLLTLLVCAVPSTALANVVHAGACARDAGATAAMPAAHAQPGGHAQSHAGHASADVQAQTAAGDVCTCGCACAGVAHCGAGAVALPGDERLDAVLRAAASSLPAAAAPAHARAGHCFDVLRPPSMS